jgi:hypothetical protein
MDELPTRNELRDIGNSLDQFRIDASALQRKIKFNNANIDARMRNGLAGRFHDIVRPVQVSYTDENNRTIYKDLSTHKVFSRKNVGYYLRMVQPKNCRNHSLLPSCSLITSCCKDHTFIALHKAFHIDYEDWAFDPQLAGGGGECDSTESEDETLSLPDNFSPRSLENAVRLYPTEVVRAIFNPFGLAYNIFGEQWQRDEAKRAVQMSATRRSTSKIEYPQPVQRRGISDSYRGSTAELATRSA